MIIYASEPRHPTNFRNSKEQFKGAKALLFCKLSPCNPAAEIACHPPDLAAFKLRPISLLKLWISEGLTPA